MNTTSYVIDSSAILSSDPTLEKLRWALSNVILPATEREAKLVRRLARHLRGLRDIPEINDALFPWSRLHVRYVSGMPPRGAIECV
jgi:hypothetical protein